MSGIQKGDAVYIGRNNIFSNFLQYEKYFQKITYFITKILSKKNKKKNNTLPKHEENI